MSYAKRYPSLVKYLDAKFFKKNLKCSKKIAFNFINTTDEFNNLMDREEASASENIDTVKERLNTLFQEELTAEMTESIKEMVAEEKEKAKQKKKDKADQKKNILNEVKDSVSDTSNKPTTPNVHTTPRGNNNAPSTPAKSSKRKLVEEKNEGDENDSSDDEVESRSSSSVDSASRDTMDNKRSNLKKVAQNIFTSEPPVEKLKLSDLRTWLNEASQSGTLVIDNNNTTVRIQGVKYDPSTGQIKLTLASD